MIFSRDIGIDLGTANTVICDKKGRIIIREPSVVAVDVKTKRVLATGDEAKTMIGRTPGSIIAVRPLQDGVIADFDMTSDMLRSFIYRSSRRNLFTRTRVVVSVPSGVTEVERRAVEARQLHRTLSLLRSRWRQLSAQGFLFLKQPAL